MVETRLRVRRTRSVRGKDVDPGRGTAWRLLLICAVGLLGLAGACGGADEPLVAWGVRFECEADLVRADVVTARMIGGSCKGRTPSHNQSIVPGAALLAPTSLADGDYGLLVAAKREGKIIATICVDVTLPSSDIPSILLEPVTGCDDDGAACTPASCSCDGNDAVCGTACADLMTDAEHCGECDNVCGSGADCIDGACVCDGGGNGVSCGDTCANLNNDVEHCGQCDNACGAGGSCKKGVCKCADDHETCGDGSDAVCADLQTDVENCGECGEICPLMTSCDAGQCRCDAGGLLVCAGTCVDEQTSSDHCGGCDNACPTGSACTEGACVCSTPGQIICGGACIDGSTDNANCGGCGVACPGGTLCQDSACRCVEGGTVTTLALCGSDPATDCVDLDANNSNCGTCGTPCEGTTSCVAGQCECPANPDICGDTCTDLQTDSANCGMCDKSCEGGLECVAGACGCSGGAAAECGTDQCCPGTEICGADGVTCECGPGTSACGGSDCADFATDNTHCGECDHACPGGTSCTAGACLPDSLPGGAGSCVAARPSPASHDYLFCTGDDDDWNAARAACRGLLGNFDLVTIELPGENNFLTAQATILDASNAWWIGARDEGSACDGSGCSYSCRASGNGGEGDWNWIAPGVDGNNGPALCVGQGTCTAVNAAFTNWNAGEPNNSCTCNAICSGSGSDEDCGSMNPDGLWNDATCGNNQHYICESY